MSSFRAYTVIVAGSKLPWALVALTPRLDRYASSIEYACLVPVDASNNIKLIASPACDRFACAIGVGRSVDGPIAASELLRNAAAGGTATVSGGWGWTADFSCADTPAAACVEGIAAVTAVSVRLFSRNVCISCLTPGAMLSVCAESEVVIAGARSMFAV